MEKNKNILVAGAASQRGVKVTRFLQNRGFNAYGIDRFEPAEQSVYRFFRMDIRHRDSLKLVASIAKADVVIFCPDTVANTEYTYPAYVSLLDVAKDTGIKRVILCIDDVYKDPKTVSEVSQMALFCITDVFKQSANMETLVITEKGNLLKEIKRFISEGGEGEDDKNSINNGFN